MVSPHTDGSNYGVVGEGRGAGGTAFGEGLVQVLEEALVFPPQLFPWMPFAEATELVLQATM